MIGVITRLEKSGGDFLILLEGLGVSPRGKGVDGAIGVLGDFGQDVFQIIEGINVVAFAGFDEGKEDG